MGGQPFAKKSLGQHWLRDKASLQSMCTAADIQADDTVVEIGPGLGTLTKVLVGKAGQVVAIELDEKLARELPDRVPADNLQVVVHDILQFDFNSLPAGYKIVANIPYYLTGKLLRVISEAANPAATAVLLVQKEVAERVAASPGAMSIVSTTTQYYWHVSLGRVVTAELFTPPPKVDSQILILERRGIPLFENVDDKRFFQLVKAGFAQPRKTLLNNLGSGLHLDRAQAITLCQGAGIDTGRRAQTLSLEEWRALYGQFNT